MVQVSQRNLDICERIDPGHLGFISELKDAPFFNKPGFCQLRR